MEAREVSERAARAEAERDTARHEVKMARLEIEAAGGGGGGGRPGIDGI